MKNIYLTSFYLCLSFLLFAIGYACWVKDFSQLVSTAIFILSFPLFYFFPKKYLIILPIAFIFVLAYFSTQGPLFELINTALLCFSYWLSAFSLIHLLPTVIPIFYEWAKGSVENTYVQRSFVRTLIVNRLKDSAFDRFANSRAHCMAGSIKKFSDLLLRQEDETVFLDGREKVVSEKCDKDVMSSLFRRSQFSYPILELNISRKDIYYYQEQLKMLRQSVQLLQSEAQTAASRWKNSIDEMQIALGFAKQQESALVQQLRRVEQEKIDIEEKLAKSTNSSPVIHETAKSTQAKLEKQKQVLKEEKKERKKQQNQLKKMQKQLEEKESELEQARLALFRTQEKLSMPRS